MPASQIFGIIVSFVLSIVTLLVTWQLKTLVVLDKDQSKLTHEIRYLTQLLKGDPPTAGVIADVLRLRSDNHWTANCIMSFHERLTALEECNNLDVRELPRRRETL